MQLSLIAQMYTAEDVLRFYQEQLATPGGIAAAIALLVLAVGLLIFDALKWLVVAVLIHVATYAIRRGVGGPVPIELIESLGKAAQPLTLAFILLLLVPSLN